MYAHLQHMTNLEHNVMYYTIFSFKHCVDLYKCNILKTIKNLQDLWEIYVQNVYKYNFLNKDHKLHSIYSEHTVTKCVHK